MACLASAAFSPITRDGFAALFAEMLLVSMLLVLAYSLAGRWRQTWMPRWVAQVLAVALAAPVGPLIAQLLSVHGDLLAFVNSRPRVIGFWWVTVGGALVGALVTLGALYRERDAQARAQALYFALERERLERQAIDARLSLLQAQIAPHFLFNTLSNVQELVESGSPRAAPVFKSLIAYLRAAMPQLHQRSATVGDELALVQSYLDLMLMRMPDRLQFRMDVDPNLRALPFPAMALLTLVENAVRHGIDPSEQGGLITVGVRHTVTALGEPRACAWVSDTGVGMSETAAPGTGLTNLRARLQAALGPQATLELTEVQPSGLLAQLSWTLSPPQK